MRRLTVRILPVNHFLRAAALAAVALLQACSSMPSMNPLDWFGSSSSCQGGAGMSPSPKAARPGVALAC